MGKGRFGKQGRGKQEQHDKGRRHEPLMGECHWETWPVGHAFSCAFLGVCCLDVFMFRGVLGQQDSVRMKVCVVKGCFLASRTRETNNRKRRSKQGNCHQAGRGRKSRSGVELDHVFSLVAVVLGSSLGNRTLYV